MEYYKVFSWVLEGGNEWLAFHAVWQSLPDDINKSLVMDEIRQAFRACRSAPKVYAASYLSNVLANAVVTYRRFTADEARLLLPRRKFVPKNQTIYSNRIMREALPIC